MEVTEYSILFMCLSGAGTGIEEHIADKACLKFVKISIVEQRALFKAGTEK